MPTSQMFEGFAKLCAKVTDEQLVYWIGQFKRDIAVYKSYIDIKRRRLQSINKEIQRRKESTNQHANNQT